MGNNLTTAKVLGITEDDIKDVMSNSGRHVSMDAPLAQGEDSTLMDVMEDEDQENPDHALISVTPYARGRAGLCSAACG